MLKEIASFKTSSDVGSVRIGNEDFEMLIPNGYGDGSTDVDIMERDSKGWGKLERYNYHGTITVTDKKVNVYYNDVKDLNNEVMFNLESGTYEIFIGERYVIMCRILNDDIKTTFES